MPSSDARGSVCRSISWAGQLCAWSSGLGTQPGMLMPGFRGRLKYAPQQILRVNGSLLPACKQQRFGFWVPRTSAMSKQSLLDGFAHRPPPGAAVQAHQTPAPVPGALRVFHRQGLTISSCNCCITSQPSRVRACEMPDLPVTLTASPGPSNHARPSIKQPNTSR